MRPNRWIVAAALVAVSIQSAAAQSQQTARFLAKEDILVYGLGLKVEPAQQTVPKDIATIVATFIQAPQLPDNLPAFAADAKAVGTLRGPGLPQPLELSVAPNTPFNIPPLSIAGTYTLDNIRLVSNGQLLLRGTPESVRIDVIDKLLVTQVTARPLTAQEIRDKGIVFNPSNFQAYNFAAAFAIQDNPVNINFTVVLPTVQGAADVQSSKATVPTVPTPTLPSLKTIIPDTLKLQTQIPNLSVIGFTLKVPELKGQNFVVPPIPGVIVIPGDIGFLNQFFSVMLMVSNAAPLGSNLVVTGLTAEIVLPPGRDGVVGTPDDPLAMAQLATGESPRIQPVVQLGPDGKRGTSDDINQLGPQETGSAEYLVEGRREGSHVVEMQITGTLIGLPIGPVTVTGRAAGSVLVRNPKFTLTFTHPQVVSAGEAYTLDVTVSNTSESPANFVSVNLHGQNISGATLVGEATKSIDMIAPGDSQMVSFALVSKVTGTVTAATLDADENIAGRFELKTSVGELGVPLSPDSLVLPQEANALPADLRTAATRLLGKAYAVATAPPAALPKDIQRFSRQIVIDSAVSVAEAGLRVTLHEPVPDSALQLAMDFDGSDYARLPALNPKPDDLAFSQSDRIAFDALRRKTVSGDAFAQAVASLLAGPLTSLGPAAFHEHMAEAVAYRPGHISVMMAGAGQLPFDLALVDSSGRRVGGVDSNGKVQKQIPFSDFMTFSGATGAAMALVTTPDQGDFVIKLTPIAGVPPTLMTLSIVAPAADGALRHIVFDNVTGVSAPLLSFAPTDPYRFSVEIAGSDPATRTPLAASSDAPVVEPPPTILGAIQQAQADVLKCDASDKSGVPVGRVAAVLFSAEVTADSAQDKVKTEDITNYTSDTNRVVSVALQPGRRIVYIALRDPIGPYVPATLTISNVADVHGHVMASQTIPIETTLDAGGVVSGRVLQADGTPVASANVRLFYLLDCGEPSWVGISSKSADADGRYSWGFVGSTLPDRIVAIDPGTDEFRDVRFTIQRSGQRLAVDIVLLGRGTLQGRTLAEDGTPLRDTVVRVTSLTDQSQYGATTDVDGKFSIGRVPVGNVLIEAVNVAAKAKTFISQAIPSAGSTTVADLVLLAVDQAQVTLKTGAISGFTLAADGITPVKGVPVIAWYQSGSQAGISCPPPAAECAAAVVNSDSTGAYVMTGLTAGTLRLQTFDQNSLRQGEARVVLPAGGAITANILLAGGLGTVRGSVLDPNGQPVPNARVGGGLSLVTTAANGQFVLTDVPIGRRQIVAVSDALGTQGGVTVDLLQEGEEIGATIVLQAVASVAGTVFEADGVTPVPGVNVYLFKQQHGEGGPEIAVVGNATTDSNGHYAIGKAVIGDYFASAFRSDFSDGNIRPIPLKFFKQVFKGDIIFRGGGGKVTGVALDSDGQTPLKASVAISGDQLVIAGGMVGVAFQYVENYKITQTDFTTGRYSFGGLWVGDVTVSAAGQFSPDPVSLKATIPAPNATVPLDIRLKATSRLTGTVFQPDGATPVGANLLVKFHSDEVKVICTEDSSGDAQCQAIPQGVQEENVVTDDKGHFLVPVINAGTYTITVEDPTSGKIGVAHGSVRPGEEGHTTVRLLGVGTVTVNVRSSDGTTPIPNAKIVLQQSDYPKKQMTVVSDANGATVFSGGDALPEGPFAVSATDERNGFTGRASGKVVRDGEQVVVNVYLFDAWGFVAGHVFRPDGFTPVPNSDVVVSNAAGPLAFSVSDANGAYEVNYVPIGAVAVDTFEAATARVGSASGKVDFNQQTVPIDVVETALGLVKGVLLDASALTPLKGWEVSLTQTLPSGRAMPTLRTTTSVDGSYSFPGASQGSLSLYASRDGVNGSARANTTIAREGQVVDVPLLATIVRPLAGGITGVVFNADGTPAASALVDFCPGGDCTYPTTTTAAPDGTFTFTDRPLGRFVIRARSQVTQDTGATVGEIAFDGQTAGVTVALRGLTKVTGTVYNADGSIAGGARLELTGVPSSGCDTPCVQFALPDGTFAFVAIPATSFTIVATGVVSDARGIVGDRLNPGETKTVQIRLEPFGQLGGRVLFPGGAPAANIVADLAFGVRHLFVQSAADGAFTFPATPLGAYTLTLQDPVGPGLAFRSGAISGPTTLADVVLDTAPPAVTTVVPAPSAIGIARNTTVEVVFSEAVDPGSVTQGNITLTDGTHTINGTLQMSNGDTTIVFTPLSQLQDQTRFTIRVTNVLDRVGKALPAPYVTSFTTVDITPPRAVSIDPAPGTSGVAIDSPVRVAFSEPIDVTKFLGPPLVVSGPDGAVAGRFDYPFGNTVLVFTPNRPFSDSASYRVDRAAATDLAGNVEPAPASYSFRTTDRTPPTLAGLIAPATVIENAQATVTANVGTTSDVALVDFYINEVLAFTSRSAPFAMTFQAIPAYGKPGDRIRLSALATDTSGNRSTAPATTAITVTADAPPTVSLTVTTPTGQLSAHNNDRVVVTVHATDDIGVVQVGYKANTGNALDAAVDAAPPPVADRTASFAFHVPADAVPGSTIRVEASASDTKRQITPAAPVYLLVLDSIPPVVTITGATTGAKVNPGQQTTVAVSVQDSGGVASITLTATGVTQFAQTRAVDPPQSSAITSFTFMIPTTAKATDSVSLVATATDRAGNIGTSANVVLPVADGTPPTITLRTQNGLTDVGAGQVQVVTADASDDIAVARIDLSGTGALTVAQSRGFSPALASASADFSFTVPTAVPEGATLTLVARATDLSGNVSAPATLTLTIHAVQNVTLPPSVLVKAGESASMTVQIPGGAASDLRIDFTSDQPDIATVTPSVSFAAGDTTKTFAIAGQSGGTAQITASIRGVPRTSMTASVVGGIVTGVVTDDHLQPVGAAQVTVNSNGIDLATVSDTDGTFHVEGANGPQVTVRATDPATQLYGFTTGALNRMNGFARINVVMTTAASIHGIVFLSNSQTPAGDGVRIDIFQANDPSTPRATTFTDASGAYGFPFVQLGEYILYATGKNGERARVTVRLDTSAVDLTQPLSFLGQGVVIGHVFDGLGAPVNAAAVTFGSSSVFGAAPDVRITTDTTGAYEFDGVLVGQFWVAASSAATGQAGTASGSITHAGESVTADVHLATFGSVAGTVFRPDKTTTVSGATVTSQVGQTTTNELGQYRFDIVPLGPVNITVYDPGTRGRAVASTTLTTQGQTQTLDAVLFAQGSIAVTVQNADGTIVPNANVYISAFNGVTGDSLYARAGSDGVAVIDHVLAGAIDVAADNGVLRGAVRGRNLAANQVLQITVRLQPTGSIAGLVLDADAQTPVSGGRVEIVGLDNTTTIGDDGTYRMDLLLLNAGGYQLKVFDSAGRARAHTKTPIPITRNGQVATANFTFVGLGHVHGQVKYAATGTTAANFSVTVQSLNPDFAGLRSGRTDAAGFYQIDDVPVGPIDVSTGDLGQQLWGEASGALARDGDTAELNILLQNNAIALPVTLSDANNFAYDVQADGTVAHGSGQFSGASHLDLLTSGAPSAFAGGEIPTVEQNGREIVTRQNGLAGLNVTRKLFVPRTGYFARFLEILSNPTTSPITVDIQVTSGLAQNLAITDTSSGDTALDVTDPATADRFVVFDDGVDGDPAVVGGQPATAFVFDGSGGSTHAGRASLTAGNPRQLQLAWQQITIAPGATFALMHFVAQQTTRQSASASADRLSQLPPEALEGLTADEIAAIANFAVAQNGLSALAPLPPLTGSITGRVLETDGTTPTAPSQVSFRSNNPFYGRTYHTTSDVAGSFAFVPAFSDGQSQPIPIDDFALIARHPLTGVSSPTVPGSFDAQATIAARNIVFSDTAMVSGVVLRHTGTAVTAGTVVAVRATPPLTVGAAINGDASYRLAGLPPGAYTLTASVPQSQGTPIAGTTTITVVAGQIVTANTITIQATGTVTGTVSTASGTPVANAYVDLNAPGLLRATRTDTGGGFTFGDVPEGTLTVRAIDPTTGLSLSATTIVQRDQTSPVTLKFPAVGRLDVQVNFASGAGAPGADVQLQEQVRGPGFRNIGLTDGGGHLTMAGLSAGPFVVQASHRSNQRIAATASGTLTTDGSVVPVVVTLPIAATVTGTVTDQNGAAVALIGVTVRSTNPAFGGFQTATTDSNGVYVVAGVPQGAFTAVVQDFSRQLFGEVNGGVDSDGQQVTANISLINNAVQLPADRYDANQNWYRIEPNGRISAATTSAFGNYWNPVDGAAQLEIVANGSATPFVGNGTNVGTMEQNGREIVVRQSAVIPGLDVTRKVFVPSNGYFARYLELLTNTGNASVTVDVRLHSTIAGDYYNPVSIVTTSSGDATLDVSNPNDPDRWVTFDDNNAGDPFISGGRIATAFVFDGPGGATRAASATLTGAGTQRLTLAYQWSAITVPAGQTVAVMHYVVEQITRDAAATAAARLAQVPSEALDGLSAGEAAAVQNFALPASGLSSVDPLPVLTAMVDGSVLASDTTTVVPNTHVQFKSSYPLFGRTWDAYSDASGAFAFKGRLDNASSSEPIPLAPFTLRATHPQTNLQIDQSGDFSGTFTGNLALPLGRATASSYLYQQYSYPYYVPANAIDGDAGSQWISNESISSSGDAPWLEVGFVSDVTVSQATLSTSSMLLARVDLFNAAGQVIATSDGVDTSSGTTTVSVAGQGIRRVRITDESDVGLVAIAELQIVGTSSSSAGVARRDITFTNSGMIGATVKRHTGALVTSGSLHLYGQGVNVTAGITAAGGYTFTGVPAGSYTLDAAADNPLGTALVGSTSITVVNGSTTTVVVPIQPTGTVTGTVHLGSGAPAVYTRVELLRSYPYFYESTSTDVNGRFVFADVPLDAFMLRGYEPNTGFRTDLPVSVSVADQVVTQNISLVAIGSVQVHVDYARGTPAPNAGVYINESWLGYFRYAGATDAGGNLTIPHVVKGTFIVRAAHPLNGNFRTDVPGGAIVNDGDSPSVKVALPPVGSIAGRVTYPDGTAVSYPTVLLIFPDGSSWYANSVDANGNFMINAVPVGQTMRVRAYWPWPNNWAYGETPFTLSADNEAQTVNVRLPGFANIRIHLQHGDGTPFANAYVQSSDQYRSYFTFRGYTDANGYLMLQNAYYDTTPTKFAEGTYTVRIYDPNTGISLVDTNGTVAFADINTTLNLEIAANIRHGNIAGHVYAIDGSTPVPGAVVRVISAADGVVVASASVGQDAAFSFTNILVGNQGFIVRASSPWNSALTAERAGSFTTEGETQTIDLSLSLTPGTISGTVFAGDGTNVVANAYVYVQDLSSGRTVATTSTDANGRYQTPTVFLGSAGFQVVARARSGLYSAAQTGSLAPPGANVTVNLTLPVTLVTISGSIFAADGATGVPHAQISLYDAANQWVTATLTDSSGAFTTGPVYISPAAFRLRVDYYDYSDESDVQGDVTGAIAGFGTQITANVTLPLSVVRGRVTFANGSPVQNLNVFATDASGRIHYAQVTNASGGYLIFNVPAGQTTVTAQDTVSGLSATATGTLSDITIPLLIDVQLPPSGDVTGTVADSAGNPIAYAGVALVSPNLRFVRWGATDGSGALSFANAPAGPVYVQATFWDGSSWRYVSASGDVVANQTLNLSLAWDGGGTVTGAITTAAGATPANAGVTLQASGSSGPRGTYSSSQNVMNGTYRFTNVPAGAVHVTITDGSDSSKVVGVTDGWVTTGGTVTLDAQYGNAVFLWTNLDGADGFRYGIGSNGELEGGGAVDGHVNGAFEGGDAIQMNGIDFPSFDAARVDGGGRQLTLGPASVGRLLIARRIFVPASGGFVRYLEVLSNPTSAVLTGTVSINGNLGSANQTRVVVPPSTTGNTLAVTDRGGICCNPALGHVFQGAGPPAVAVSAVHLSDGASDFSLKYPISIPAGATVTIMHFEIERDLSDTAGAEAEARALVGLTDPNALAGMSDTDKAQVVNFVIPIGFGALGAGTPAITPASLPGLIELPACGPTGEVVDNPEIRGVM